MGTAMTGFLGGFLEAKTKFDQLDQQKAERDAQLAIHKEELKLRQQTLKGQEAHNLLLNRSLEAKLAQELREQQGQQEIGQLFGAGQDLSDPAAQQAVLAKAWKSLPLEQTMKLQEHFRKQNEYTALSRLETMTTAPPGSEGIAAPPMREAAQPALQAPTKLTLPPGLSPAFLQKTQEVAGRLGMKPDDLLRIMHFETGGTLSPSQVNQAGSGATGLIQFMPETAKSLGTTTQDLAKMTPEAQLDYVEKYLTPYKGKLGSFDQAYLAVLNPAAMGQSPETVMWKQGTPEYQQNSGLDTGKKGFITVGDAVNAPLQRGGQARAPQAPAASPGQAPSSLARQPSIVPTSPEMMRLNADIGALDLKERRVNTLLAQSPGLRANPSVKELLVGIRKDRTELEKQRLELTKEERPKFTPELTDYVIGESQQRPEVLFATPEGRQQLQELRRKFRTEKLQERIDVSAAQGREAVEKELDKPITPNEATDLGLPAYAFTRRQVAAMGIIPLSADLQKQMFTAQGTSLLLDRFEERAGKLFKGITPESRLGETGKKLVERFTQTNPDVAVYQAMADGFLASFARAAGEVGTLNEGDIGRARSLLPTIMPPDTEAVATEKLKELRTFITEKLRRGRQGAPTGGAGGTPAPSTAPAAPAAPATPGPVNRYDSMSMDELLKALPGATQEKK
jgi:hypothetical protein